MDHDCESGMTTVHDCESGMTTVHDCESGMTTVHDCESGTMVVMKPDIDLSGFISTCTHTEIIPLPIERISLRPGDEVYCFIPLKPIAFVNTIWPYSIVRAIRKKHIQEFFNSRGEDSYIPIDEKNNNTRPSEIIAEHLIVPYTIISIRPS